MRWTHVLVTALFAAACAPQSVSREPELTDMDGAAGTADAAPSGPGTDGRGPFIDRPPLDVRPASPFLDAGGRVFDARVIDARTGPIDTRGPADSATRPPDAGGAPGANPTVLLVVGEVAPLAPDDLRLRMRLEEKGLTVKLAADDAPAGQSSSGTNLVVISGTSLGANVAGRYLAVNVPVLSLEPASFPPMRLTAMNDQAQGVASGTQITIVDGEHPIAAGQTGTVTVTTAAVEFGWGVPAANAARIATVPGMANRFLAFAYERGAMLAGTPPLAAPARRAGLFVHTTVSERLTPIGFQIFDAAVDWTLGR